MSVANGTRSVLDCHVSIATIYQGLRATSITFVGSDNALPLAGRLPRLREVASQKHDTRNNYD